MIDLRSEELQRRCELLRSLHSPGTPLLLPNAWDASTARAVVDAGLPVVATTSGGVAATLGFEDFEAAPAEEMFAAAGRIVRAVDVPVTVDAEAGYGMAPADLVAALRSIGASGCNLEDTDHRARSLRETGEHAKWLSAVREAAAETGYPLVVNARIDVFVAPFFTGAGPEQLAELMPEAIERATAYLEAGADCVYPICLWEASALEHFVAEVNGPVNVLRLPQTPSVSELAALGVARISWGTLLHLAAMATFKDDLASVQD